MNHGNWHLIRSFPGLVTFKMNLNIMFLLFLDFSFIYYQQQSIETNKQITRKQQRKEKQEKNSIWM